MHPMPTSKEIRLMEEIAYLRGELDATKKATAIAQLQPPTENVPTHPQFKKRRIEMPISPLVGYDLRRYLPFTSSHTPIRILNTPPVAAVTRNVVCEPPPSYSEANAGRIADSVMHALKRIDTIQQTLTGGWRDKGPRGRGWIYSLAQELLLLRIQNPQMEASPEFAPTLERLFSSVFNHISLQMEDPAAQANWMPYAQEIKAFFEAGFLLRRHIARCPQVQMAMFTRYVHILNMFITLPEDAPPQVDSTADSCWLKPTLSATMPYKKVTHALNSILPDLEGRDAVVTLYADMETDFITSPIHNLSKAQQEYHRKNALKLTLSILQSLDFSKHSFSEGLKSPPVVVVCPTKAMVLKLCDYFNYHAKYEYANGYRGAEACYGDTEGLSDIQVSILVGTSSSILKELQRGRVSFTSLELAVFIYQLQAPQENIKLKEWCSPTARTLMFVSLTYPPKQTKDHVKILLNTPLVVGWEPNKVEITINEVGYAPTLISEWKLLKQMAGSGKAQAESDFVRFGINPKVVAALEAKAITNASELQQQMIPRIMTGNSVICSADEGVDSALSFIIPTLHLMLNYPVTELKTRVLVLVEGAPDVDRIVAAYIHYSTGLPGIAPEGIHRARLTQYTTPVNTRATVVVCTGAKLASAMRNKHSSALNNSISQIDFSDVDAMILYNCRVDHPHSDEYKAVVYIHNAITKLCGQSPQVIAFTRRPPLHQKNMLTQAAADLYQLIAPNAEYILPNAQN
jgi:hypothetical protein